MPSFLKDVLSDCPETDFIILLLEWTGDEWKMV